MEGQSIQESNKAVPTTPNLTPICIGTPLRLNRAVNTMSHSVPKLVIQFGAVSLEAALKSRRADQNTIQSSGARAQSAVTGVQLLPFSDGFRTLSESLAGVGVAGAAPNVRWVDCYH
jgi:hypothetical protein